MVKIITLVTKFIVVTIAALLMVSCNLVTNINSITGSGHVTTEKRIVNGDFKNIEVGNAIDLVLEQSDKVEIIVEADDNLQKEITTKVENGKLVIACKYSSFINITSKKVIVRAPIIEGIEANSASTVNSKSTIKAATFKIDASSAASLDLNIEAEKIICDTGSGSTIDLKGKAISLQTNSSSGSSINAGELLVNDIKSEASSGSIQSLQPLVSLDAEASSGANISYKNKPKSLKKSESSGGSISQE
jgi:hypothetical protein